MFWAITETRSVLFLLLVVDKDMFRVLGHNRDTIGVVFVSCVFFSKSFVALHFVSQKKSDGLIRDVASAGRVVTLDPSNHSAVFRQFSCLDVNIPAECKITSVQVMGNPPVVVPEQSWDWPLVRFFDELENMGVHFDQSPVLQIEFSSPPAVTHARDHWKHGSDFPTTLRDEIRGCVGPQQRANEASIKSRWVEWVASRAETCPCRLCREGRTSTVNASDVDKEWASVSAWYTISQKSTEDRVAFARQCLETQLCFQNVNWFAQRGQYLYHIGPRVFCWWTWSNLMGFGPGFFRRRRAEFEAACRDADDARSGDMDALLQRWEEENPLEMSRTQRARYFLREFVEFQADTLPDVESARAMRMPLVIKKHIYEDMYCPQIEVEAKHQPVVYRHFCHLWVLDWGHVKLTDKRRFGICSDCWNLEKAYFTSSNTVEARKELHAAKVAHIAEVRDARQKATSWHEAALADPDDCLFLIADAMDSQKTLLPCDGPRTAKHVHLENGYHSKLMNILTSLGNFFFYSDETTAANSNSLLFMILRVFEIIKQRRGRLPSKLFLVMDSCSVNKSETVVTFLALLKRLNNFKLIKSMFMPVGHTHWLNDQIFSRISTHFSSPSCSVLTPQDLESYLAGSVTLRSLGQLRSHVEYVERVPDLGSWLRVFRLPSLSSSLRFWNMMEWEFRCVRNPASGDLEVQMTQNRLFMTVEETIQAHWTDTLRGALCHRIMDRYLGNYRFHSPVAESIYRDYTLRWNQPETVLVWSMWPRNLLGWQYTAQGCANFEHCRAPNWDGLKTILESMRLDKDPAWLAMFKSAERRCQHVCEICRDFDRRIAEAKPPGRLRRGLVGDAEHKRRSQEVRTLESQRSAHILTEEHVSPPGKFRILERLATLGARSDWLPSTDRILCRVSPSRKLVQRVIEAQPTSVFDVCFAVSLPTRGTSFSHCAEPSAKSMHLTVQFRSHQALDGKRCDDA